MSTSGELQPARPPIPAGVLVGRVIAIGRNLDPAVVPAICDALVESGIRAFEVTLTSQSALETIALLARRYAEVDLSIGAGTVLQIDEARVAVDAGARYLVMPHLDVEIVAWASSHGIPSFPGCQTVTEALTAWRAGASAVKLFPASVVGTAFVRELRGPLPQIPLVPTGGVTVDNAPAFIAAGAIAVGMGSWLTAGGDVAVIHARARQLTAALAGQARG